MSLLDEIVEAVLAYVSAPDKNRLVIDEERAKEAVYELLRERLDRLLTEGKS